MLYRKIGKYIEDLLKSDSDKILILEGARLLKNAHTTEEFYLTLSMTAGSKLGKADNTLVFTDEIQHYPQYLTMLKFLRQEHRYRFITSGCLLGIALRSSYV